MLSVRDTCLGFSLEIDIITFCLVVDCFLLSVFLDRHCAGLFGLENEPEPFRLAASSQIPAGNKAQDSDWQQSNSHRPRARYDAASGTKAS